MKRTVVVDLDGTIYDTVGAIIRYVHARHDVLLRREDQKTWSLGDMVSCREDIPEARRKLIVADIVRLVESDNMWYQSMQPLPGAQQAVNMLAEHFRIVAITSRPIDVRSGTFVAVARDFSAIEEIHHTNAYKAAEAHNQGALAALEDSATAVESYVKRKIFTYHIRHPWGTDVRVKRGRHLVVEVPSALAAAEDLLRRLNKETHQHVSTASG